MEMTTISEYRSPTVPSGQINVNSKSTDPRARLLSNLVNRPFSIDGEMCASVEGFMAGILYPVGEMRRRAFASSFVYAQNLMLDGMKVMDSTVELNFREATFEYASIEHKHLIERSIYESIIQNPDRRQALLDTIGLEIVHVTGIQAPLNEFLTADEFAAILTRVRNSM